MLQKQRKAGEPTTPSPFTSGTTASKAAQAAQLGREAMSNLDRVTKQAQEQERRRHLSRRNSCACG